MKVALALAALIGSDCCKGEFEAIPKDAKRLVFDGGATVVYWFRPMERGEGQRLFATVEVNRWPDKAWGIELSVTPVPLCCGKRRHQVLWRRSERLSPRLITELDAGERFEMDIRFP